MDLAPMTIAEATRLRGTARAPIALRGRTRSWSPTTSRPSGTRRQTGTWEPELLDALERLISPGDAILDIGAWVGPTSLFAASSARTW